jgi:hypothetical protein
MKELKIGDKVRVVRAVATDDKNGMGEGVEWQNSWVGEMDKMVGKTTTITGVCINNTGYAIADCGFSYPLACFEPVFTTLPDVFKFTTPGGNFRMTRVDGTKFVCTTADEVATPEHKAFWEESALVTNLNGCAKFGCVWQYIEEVKPAKPAEPNSFRFRHVDDATTIYTVDITGLKGSDRATVKWDGGNTTYDVSSVKDYVSKGTWVVLPPTVEPTKAEQLQAARDELRNASIAYTIAVNKFEATAAELLK